MANVKIGNRIFSGVDGVVLNNADSGTTLYSLMDWQQNEESKPNYVRNRPFWIKEQNFNWDGITFNKAYDLPDNPYSIKKAVLLTEEVPPIPELLIGAQISLFLKEESNQFVIETYCASQLEYEQLLKNTNSPYPCVLVPGGAIDYPGSWIFCLLNNQPVFGLIPAGAFATDSPAGLYVWSAEDENGKLSFMESIHYNDIVINNNYASFFNYIRNPIYPIYMGKDLKEVQANLSQLNLSQFQRGDIILITMDPEALGRWM